MEKHNNGSGAGTLYVVGTGPGSVKHMTVHATEVLKKADIIIGYRTYLDLIPEFLENKEVVSSEMMKEVDRCRSALEKTIGGKNVALVSGGDPGIYAMAGLVYEMAKQMDADCSIEIIPGLAAINSCAARLGAPLMHDFAAVSLSDLLTPWEVIEKRLDAAASADFVTAIYNPKSKKRTTQIVRAQEIFLAHRSPETVVGIVTAATRENETIVVTTLGEMLEQQIGMQSTIIIGNSQTYSWNDLMVTPRGYSDKYSL
ncbi:precorrin-3B C(17)-methyltransferase [Desulforhopalus singaporensis]|uniref:Precorrin-3B C17-methyltransferase n=1 Tax=Desulforhopalus singaporensis TaxID=91360 RepID=A0A1H0NWB2_9BACT|nr:precorrin-3B C(17)-methyltransferase [Desulforhopalus singaporensis]SDO97067.1 precorrin-3B C17-methyltransferase [Desulforhopalus singaporensis]